MAEQLFKMEALLFSLKAKVLSSHRFPTPMALEMDQKNTREFSNSSSAACKASPSETTFSLMTAEHLLTAKL